MWGAGTVRSGRPNKNQQRRGAVHSPRPRRWLALWGFALWAFLAAAYWTFHWEVLEPRSTWLVVKQGLLWPYTLDEDATWAAFTHFIGFAIFVFLADGRKRWILITGVVAFSFYWLLLLLQVPTRLWSTWTNVLGFAVMLVSSIVGLGLFSALAQALALLRMLVCAHPELKRELERELEGHPLLMIAVSGRDGACPALIPAAFDDPDFEKCFLCGTPAGPGASVAVCAAWRQDSATGKMLACKPYAELRDKLRAVEARKRELEAAEEQGIKRIHEMQEQHAQRQARADDEIRWLTSLLHKHLPEEKLQRFASRVPPLHVAHGEDIDAPLGTVEAHASSKGQNSIRRDPAPSHVQLQRQVDLLADLLVQARGGGSTGGKREVTQRMRVFARPCHSRPSFTLPYLSSRQLSPPWAPPICLPPCPGRAVKTEQWARRECQDVEMLALRQMQRGRAVRGGTSTRSPAWPEAENKVRVVVGCLPLRRGGGTHVLAEACLCRRAGREWTGLRKAADIVCLESAQRRGPRRRTRCSQNCPSRPPRTSPLRAPRARWAGREMRAWSASNGGVTRWCIVTKTSSALAPDHRRRPGRLFKHGNAPWLLLKSVAYQNPETRVICDLTARLHHRES
jgi:hypothetical protein